MFLILLSNQRHVAQCKTNLNHDVCNVKIKLLIKKLPTFIYRHEHGYFLHGPSRIHQYKPSNYVSNRSLQTSYGVCMCNL